MLTAANTLARLVLAMPALSGSGLCPAPEAVRRAAEALSFPARSSEDEATIEAAEVEERAAEDTAGQPANVARARLRLTLRDRTGATLGEKSFAATADCDGLASAVALTLLFWEGLPAGPRPQMPGPPPPAQLRPVVVVAAAPAPVPAALEPRWHLGAGFAPLASVAPGAGTALAGLAELALSEPSRRWGVVLSVEGEGSRSLALQTGSASWNRWALGLGIERRFGLRALPRLSLVAQADLAAALLFASGRGFEVDRSALSADAGLRAGAKLEWARAATRVWLGGFLEGWPIPEEVTLASASGGPRAPQLEVLFGLGLDGDLF